jgi:ribosomal protein S6--L-glutamate ligase
MAGIDLLPDSATGRLTVIEVNAVPGWRALGAATGVDVAREILLELVGR